MTVPVLGGTRPAMILRRVDLPQPLEPITEAKPPFTSVRSMLSRAWTSRRTNVLLTDLSS